MSDREDILQGIRAAIIAAFTLTDSQVIAWASDGVRPELPYMTVKVANHDTPSGVVADWTVHGDNGGTPTKGARGPRTSLVELNAYGLTAIEWLEDFPDHVHANVLVQAALESAGIVVTGYGQPVDVSALLDTDTEVRALRTLTVSYERVGEAFDRTELLTVEVDETFNSPTGPGSVTLGAVLDPDNPPT